MDLLYKRKGEESDDDEPNSDNEAEENSDPENEDDEDDEESENEERKILKKASKKSSIVDDQFFKLSEMEAFLEHEDKKAMGKIKEKDDGIDYFQDIEDDSDSENEDDKNLKYQDFFDDEEEGNERRKKSVHFEDEQEYDDEEEEEEEDKNEEKSSYEVRQEKLQHTIQRLEQKALGGKSWQLKGEINANNRPENALLEEYLEFDAATRPAPIITEQTTMLLEDIIKQRIRDRAFDDVERKEKPTQSVSEYRKTLVLDQEKSKESLAQIYEKEFLKAASKMNPDEVKEDEPESHKVIRKGLSDLFAKLDALSNYHFTPKPAAPDVKIITNTPAIQMEEVAPIAMSNATLLAPEEVKKKGKGDVMVTAEMTKTDKNRARRQKKRKQKEIKKLQDARDASSTSKDKKNVQEKGRLMKAVMKSKNVEAMKISKISNIKTSSAFFSMLNEQEASSNKKEPKTGVKRKQQQQQQPQGISAKFVKL